MENKSKSIFGDSGEMLKRLWIEAHNTRADNGEIWINGFIDESAIELAAMRLVTQIQSRKFDKITIFINSGGGSVDDGFSVIDFIRMSPIPVWTVNIGSACSMALSILLAGDRRYALEHSSFMAHALSASSGMRKIDEQKGWFEFLERQQDRMTKYYAQRSKKSLSFWKKKLDGADFWFDSKEALAMGVVDEVVTDHRFFEELFEETRVTGE